MCPLGPCSYHKAEKTPPSPGYVALCTNTVYISKPLATGFGSRLPLSLLVAHHFLSGACSEDQRGVMDGSSLGTVLGGLAMAKAGQLT